MTERFGQQFLKMETPSQSVLKSASSGHADHLDCIAKAPSMQDIDSEIALRPSGETGGAEQHKRRQILEGACRMFLAHGFDAASMGAIAREAGVSKGTLRRSSFSTRRRQSSQNFIGSECSSRGFYAGRAVFRL
jgi:hypothetical protein